MGEKIYTCRYCGKKFVAKDEEREITWHQRAKSYNYHMDCWKKHIKANIGEERSDDEYLDLIFEVITNDLHSTYNYFLICKQFEKMLKDNKTAKGIYFTCYWYFVIKNKEYKPEYGIGIIPYIYDDSVIFWQNEERKQKGIMEEILKIQEIEKAEGRRVGVRRSNRRTVKTAEPEI